MGRVLGGPFTLPVSEKDILTIYKHITFSSFPLFLLSFVSCFFSFSSFFFSILLFSSSFLFHLSSLSIFVIFLFMVPFQSVICQELAKVPLHCNVIFSYLFELLLFL